MARISRTSRGKRPHFFEEKSLDQLVSMFLALMSETWVLKERVFVLERLAESKGLMTAKEIEAFDLEAEDKEVLAANRRAFLEDIFATLQADHENTTARQSAIDEMTEAMTRQS